MNRNYRKEIETLLNDNGLVVRQTTGIGCDYKTIYYSKKATGGADAIMGKNYKAILFELYRKFNKKAQNGNRD